MAATFPEFVLPPRVGLGLKGEHVAEILQDLPDVGWFEVHAENYMGAGGPPHRTLTAIREHYPLSLHGIGLSIGSAAPLDQDHLARLAALTERYEPAMVSEHLAWSSHENVYFNDLLPVPYTDETLSRVCDHVDEVQAATGRRILIENPSTYTAFAAVDMDEIDFLTEIARRTGCGLLLDVNNVYVSAVNHGFDANAYLQRFPLEHVLEIHLAGHAVDADERAAPLLIDAHDCEVDDVVLDLYVDVIGHTGPLPTLIERDNNVPAWTVLLSECRSIEAIFRNAIRPPVNAAAG